MVKEVEFGRKSDRNKVRSSGEWVLKDFFTTLKSLNIILYAFQPLKDFKQQKTMNNL